jgi:hypothetical protein
MLQFDAAPVVTSNPFSVNGEQFLSRNREMLEACTTARDASSMRRMQALNDVLQRLNEM